MIVLTKKQIDLPPILISEDQILERVRELGKLINKEYTGQEIVAVAILKGSVVFFSDMIRQFTMPVRCEFIATSSYGDDKKSSGEVKLTMDTKFPLEGKNILVLEDIVDSGLTLSYILKLLQARNPKSIKVCSLLFKPESLQTELEIDYVGFEIGNEFVVGYGLDYAGLYRNLPYVGILPD
jgi:hypoxanthine phosphoribosyltransferase